jgi:hypothetical protein
MSNLDFAVQQYFTSDTWSGFTAEQIALAKAMAIEDYSQKKPRIVQSDRVVNAQTALLPSEWINGFSEIIEIEYPITDYPISISAEGEGRYRLPVLESTFNGAAVRLQDGFIVLASAHEDRFDAVGLVLTSETTHATYSTDGTITLEDWSMVTGEVFLIPNSYYFLQSAPGMLGTEPPEGAPVVRVGKAMSPTEFDIEIKIVL